MISVVRANKHLPYKPIAYTDEHEVAYYCPVSLEGDSPVAQSPSGADWKPEILKNGRLTIFVAGNPGAGTSYLSKELIQSLPSDYDILLFTALEEEDGNFRELDKRLYKIRMEPENLMRMTLSNIRSVSKNPILLFDDIDKIGDKAVSDATFHLLEDALANGRGHETHDGKGDIHVIVTSHALNDYRKTKYTLENSDYVALFPQSTTYAQMARMFDKLGLSKEMCADIMARGKRGDFRSIIIHKVAPMYMIYGDTITLI